MRGTLRYYLLLIMSFIAVTSHGEKMIVDSYSLSAMEGPEYNTRYMYQFARGDKLDVIEIDGRWAKINHNGKIRYVEACFLRPADEEIEAGNVPAWKIPGPNHRAADSFGWYFSTDRIMESIPPINILETHIPFDTDICFKIAAILLLVTGIAMLFIAKKIVYGNIFYWIFYTLTMIIGICELIYLLGSPDPLGYCDINNMSFFKGLFNLFLTALAMYQQLKLYSTIMFVAQEDTDFNFAPGIGVKLMMAVTVYFIVSVFVYHFFHTTFPAYVTWIVLSLLAIPILIMIYGLIHTRETSVFMAMLPFYIVMTMATITFFCLIGVALALFMVLTFIVKLICGDDIRYVKYKGVWYYCDYDTWLEGSRQGLWENSSSFRPQ